MKIPEKPVALPAVQGGTVQGSPLVQDSGPLGSKAPAARVELPVSQSAQTIAAMVDSGQLSPAQAMELVIDSIVQKATGADPAGLRQFIISHIATDPQLRQLAASFGVDTQTMDSLVNPSGQVKS